MKPTFDRKTISDKEADYLLEVALAFGCFDKGSQASAWRATFGANRTSRMRHKTICSIDKRVLAAMSDGRSAVSPILPEIEAEIKRLRDWAWTPWFYTDGVPDHGMMNWFHRRIRRVFINRYVAALMPKRKPQVVPMRSVDLIGWRRMTRAVFGLPKRDIRDAVETVR